MKKRLKKIIKKLRKFKGIAWITTVVSFFGLMIYGIVKGIPLCTKIANLIAVLYFLYVSIIARDSYEREWAVICFFLFLFFLFW